MFDINKEIEKVRSMSKQDYMAQTLTEDGYSSSDFYAYMRWPLSWLKHRIDWIQINEWGDIIAFSDKILYPILFDIIEIKENLGIGDDKTDQSLEIFYDYYSKQSNEQN